MVAGRHALGIVLEELGDEDDARQVWRQQLALEENDENRARLSFRLGRSYLSSPVGCRNSIVMLPCVRIRG
jgi:hypothetical protein